MNQLFRLSNNTTGTRGYPWAFRVTEGLKWVKTCFACDHDGRQIWKPVGDILVELEPDKGVRWPDLLGCGSLPLLIVSERVLHDWSEYGIGNHIPSNSVKIVGSLPAKLKGVSMPKYFWIDGSKMGGGKLDFDDSGFVDVRICPECGTRTKNISATMRRRASGEFPFKLESSSWSGAAVFTTDLSPYAFFCTQKVVACAKEKKHTNFLLTPEAEIN